VRRVDDALNATRAAVEEGIVPGGGVALLWASRSIKAKGDNEDQEAGINIVRRALQAPIRQIAENAGVEVSIVVGKVTDQKSPSFGYDAQTGEYGDPIKKGQASRHTRRHLGPRKCQQLTQSGHIRARPGNQMAGSSRGFLWNALAGLPPRSG